MPTQVGLQVQPPVGGLMVALVELQGRGKPMLKEELDQVCRRGEERILQTDVNPEGWKLVIRNVSQPAQEKHIAM